MKLISTKGKTYSITDEEIKEGDYIFNINIKAIDKCICVFKNDLLVELTSGKRAIISKLNYRLAIEVNKSKL